MKLKRKTFVLWILLFISILIFFIMSKSPQDEIVYVTSTGKSYHREACSYLISSKIAVSLDEAIQSYIPCAVCNPPVAESIDIEKRNTDLYRVNMLDLKKSSDANIDLMLKANIIRHIDGDTVRVRFSNLPKDLSAEETIRFLGVDTPETVHPNQEVQRFGKEASEYTKNSLLGKDVYIAFDWDLRDRYGRLLAYIYIEPGRCFNTILVQEGYGHAYLQYPFQFLEEFKILEQEARQQKRGLWATQ